jgi:putative nucleotidyltransferase with HDIG domain
MTDNDRDSSPPIDHVPDDPDQLQSRALRLIRAVESPQANLPTLPSVALEISRMAADDTASARDLERRILTDTALAAKVLGVANSAYYGLRETVTGVRQAVVLMGFREVQNLVLGVSVIGLFNPRLSAAGLSMTDLWAHAVAVAGASAALAAGAPLVATAENAFTAGLLHDLGKPLLLSLFPEDFTRAAMRARQQGCSFFEAEAAVNGVTHDVLGDLFCRASSFPEVILAGVANHHEPDFRAEPAGLDVIVHLADALVVRLEAGWDCGQPPAPFDPRACDRLGLDMEAARQLVQRAAEDTPSIIEALL